MIQFLVTLRSPFANPGRREGPIELIRAEHEVQRALCDSLDRLVDGIEQTGAPALARQIHDYLSVELSRHIADEEENLFPLLRQRARPEDEIEAIADQLAAEHATDRSLTDTVLEGLHLIAGGKIPDPALPFVSATLLFAETQRRHLAWENSLVLPLARRRLAANDIEELARAMAARRGLRQPE